MTKQTSIFLLLGIVALCLLPLFSPNDATAQQPTVQTEQPATMPEGYNATDTIAKIAAPTTSSTDATTTDPVTPAEPAPTVWQRILAFLRENTAEGVMALLAISKIVTNLTPTSTDNRWYDMIEKLFDAIFPNLKKGGGTHKPPA